MNHDITVISIHEYLSAYENQELGEKELKELFTEFFCSKNKDVEQFLKEQSIEFTKNNQSVTYLLFAKRTWSLLGYFTLAIKPISLKAEHFSNTAKRKIARVSQYDEINKTYTLSAYLIAQLGKNFANSVNEKISGTQLLQSAIEIIEEIQKMVGGMVVFLETENSEQLLDFYEKKNQFKRFDVRESSTKKDLNYIQLLKIL